MSNVLGSLITLIYANFIICTLLDFEVKNKKRLYILGIFIVGIVFCNTFVLIQYGYASFIKYYPLLIHIPSYFCYLLISKFKGIKLVFIMLTAFVFSTPGSLVALSISSFFDYRTDLINVLYIATYIPLAFIIFKYLRPLFLYMLRNSESDWLGFCSIPLSYYGIIYFKGMRDISTLGNRSVLVIYLLVLTLTSFSYVMILRFFMQTREHYMLQNEQVIFKSQVSAAQVHLEALKESQEKTIIYRHDIKHHLNLINAYLGDNNIKAAQGYVKEVEKSIDDAKYEQYCSNYTVNLILSSYIAKAKKEGIVVETRIELSEHNNISDIDLCVIFSNAIENATNACKAMSITKERIINILCKTKNDKLLIQITNSYEGSVALIEDMPISFEEGHGYGTKSIAAVAQKYEGICSFCAHEGIFKLNIII